jgi:hypothetical protein
MPLWKSGKYHVTGHLTDVGNARKLEETNQRQLLILDE